MGGKSHWAKTLQFVRSNLCSSTSSLSWGAAPTERDRLFLLAVQVPFWCCVFLVGDRAWVSGLPQDCPAWRKLQQACSPPRLAAGGKGKAYIYLHWKCQLFERFKVINLGLWVESQEWVILWSMMSEPDPLNSSVSSSENLHKENAYCFKEEIPNCFHIESFFKA